ncbi:GWxTD domain-containing protein [Aliifodinibius salipaludis]|uniref:GWxTD domain-containing protein n=2 Tax=Fodinibius salipaludis TaxID=2032627 RepID=A0A2A2G7D7_9BACT|nr:GWxTD domain-containing protein [Aliifodinibius salipaludis]
MRTLLLFFTCLFAAQLISCSSSKMDNVQRGIDYNYKSGYPEFRSSVFGFVEENEGPVLEITTDIVKGSLVYGSKGETDSLSADVAVDIQITDLNGEQNIGSKRITRQVVTGDESITHSREVLSIPYQLQVKPGNYEVSVTVRDLNSKQKLTQTSKAYIPGAKQNDYTLSEVQLFGKENGDNTWSQISGYHVSNAIDSLRFVFQVISPQPDTPLTLDTRLVSFASDTGLPRAITRNNYSSSSIEYKGIDFDQTTEIQSTRRVLSDYGSVFVEYKFANQNRGNYRFEVTAAKENDNDEEIFKGRSFGIKSKNFPAVESVRELARPLYYLMGRGDHEELMAISDTDSLKQAMDRFWLKNIGNKREAQQVIEQYYTRVEEANKRFSNFKEGWKTDRGMVYILFGEPFHTRDRLRQLVWYYSYNTEDPRYRFFFEQPKLNNQFFPFDHYVLNRNNNYYNIVYTQRGLWLNGQILQRQI